MILSGEEIRKNLGKKEYNGNSEQHTQPPYKSEANRRMV
jgi:hypothetical protein